MRKLIMIAILSLSISGIAQDKKGREKIDRQEFTPEQKTELQVKKLTLALDLSAKQQKEISEIMTNQQVKREAMKTELKSKRAEKKKLTSDEKFVLKSRALDEKIAFKSQVKKVLTPEQIAKWEKMPKHNIKREKKVMKRKQQMEN